MSDSQKLMGCRTNYSEEALEDFCASYRYMTDGTLLNLRGKIVGSYTRKYARLFTKHGTVSVSRLLWFFHHGRWPAGEIDHIDGNTHNNSVDNLRECSRLENAKNLRTYRSSSTGVKGVYKQDNKYRAAIQSDNIRHGLGSFNTLEEATAAYEAASKVLHKQFSNLTNSL